MTLVELFKNIKNSLYEIINDLFRDFVSFKVKLMWISAFLFIFSVLYGLKHPSSVASTAVTATASVFSIILTAYTSVQVYQRKLDSNGKPDQVDPDSQSD